MSNFTHILFVDPLEKLSPKKDSSLQLALALKERGRKVYLIFEDQLFFQNTGKYSFKVFDFEGNFEENSPYLQKFSLLEPKNVLFDQNTVLHMRLDPPFDSRYLRFLWILRGLVQITGVKVLNDPEGIAVHNEKMISYELENSVETFVGSSQSAFKNFLEMIREKEGENFGGLILKPLDLYQGIGVEKVDPDLPDGNMIQLFVQKGIEYGGPVVAQTFLKDVYKGEIRSLFFNGVELGSILKTPPEGQFLANIAQGAKYGPVRLEKKVQEECQRLSIELAKKGVPWVAYDILGGKIQEANLTCPGLLVEVSKAMKENLAFQLIELMEGYLMSRKD